MLESIDERRKRAVEEARWFLIAAGVVGSFFVLVLVSFSYFLVNEAAAGAAKSLADLSRATQEISELFRSRNVQFQAEINPVLWKLDRMDAGIENKDLKDQFHSALLGAQNTVDLNALGGTLNLLCGRVSRDGATEHAFAAAACDANQKFQQFDLSERQTMFGLFSRTQDLKALIPKAEDALSKPENHTAEVIKRLALGVIVSTFFLAFLRSLINLHKTRYLQVLQAERDEFAVRRFYVVFKSSEASYEQRKTVLESFMTLASANGVQPKEPADEDTKQGLEIVKEMVQALQKRV